MYGIFVVDCGSSKDKRGWFVRTKRNKGEDPNNLNGIQCIEPVLTEDMSNVKTWVKCDAAVKYAETLKYRLKTVTFYPMLNFDSRYYHNMKYVIRVMDLNNDVCVHNIVPYSFNSSSK